ncbi:MAG: CNNM domain-containing protein, partial [Brachymonas denitrificans]
MSFTQSLVILLALIAASSFFSMAEISLAASRRVRLRQMADDGDPRADTVMHVQEQPGYYFTAVQIGQNAVAILGGIVGEGSLSPYIADALYWINNPVVLRHLSAALSFIAIISAFILLSDLLPKRIGMSQPEKFAVRLIRPMQACVALLKPIV